MRISIFLAVGVGNSFLNMYSTKMKNAAEDVVVMMMMILIKYISLHIRNAEHIVIEKYLPGCDPV
jgi:hypothetical protein